MLKIDRGCDSCLRRWLEERAEHEPLMEMLSPIWASVKMSAASETVREVPPPPELVVSRASRAETAMLGVS